MGDVNLAHVSLEEFERLQSELAKYKQYWTTPQSIFDEVERLKDEIATLRNFLISIQIDVEQACRLALSGEDE